jgi:hypothetical protein
MHRLPYFCFEKQSVDEVRNTMRALGLRYLVVGRQSPDRGMVKVEDLMPDKKQDPPEPHASQGGK